MVSVNAYWLNVQMSALVNAPFPDLPTKSFSSANKMVDFWTVNSPFVSLISQATLLKRFILVLTKVYRVLYTKAYEYLQNL